MGGVRVMIMVVMIMVVSNQVWGGVAFIAMHTPPDRRLELSTCPHQKWCDTLEMHMHCHNHTAVLCCVVLLQDQQAMQTIADYFQHPIPEVPWNNEDEFISVLNKAGLTDQT